MDFKTAFDSISRYLALRSLSNVGISVNVLNLIAAILQENRITIDDGFRTC